MSDVADRYNELADLLTRTVEAVREDRWDRPSPCEGWTARDVLAHVARTQWEHLARVGLLPDGATLPEDARDAWATARDRLRSVLADPERADAPYQGYFGPTTFAATVDQFYSSDMVIHRWDIARATGLTDHEAMRPGEVQRLRAEYEGLGDAMRQPGVLGPPVEVADDADPQSQLLGFLGRRP